MNVSVGVMEGQPSVEVELSGTFRDSSGKAYPSGHYRFTSEATLKPQDPAESAFTLNDVTMPLNGIGERLSSVRNTPKTV